MIVPVHEADADLMKSQGRSPRHEAARPTDGPAPSALTTLAQLGLSVLLVGMMIAAVAVAAGRPTVPLQVLAVVRSAGGGAPITAPRADVPVAARSTGGSSPAPRSSGLDPGAPADGSVVAPSPGDPTPDRPAVAITADVREVSGTIVRDERAGQAAATARAAARRSAAHRATAQRAAAQAVSDRRSAARRTSTPSTDRSAAEEKRKKSAARTSARRKTDGGTSAGGSRSKAGSSAKPDPTSSRASSKASGTKPDSDARSSKRPRGGLLRAGVSKVKKTVATLLHR